MLLTTSHLIPIVAPFAGQRLWLSPATESVFSAGLVTHRQRLIPQTSQLVALCAGFVTMIANRRQVLGFCTPTGLVVNLHFGLTLGSWTQARFRLVVQVGDRVTAGQPLAVVETTVVPRAKVPIPATPTIMAAIARMHASLLTASNQVRPIGTVITSITLNMAANHRIAMIGPPESLAVA